MKLLTIVLAMACIAVGYVLACMVYSTVDLVSFLVKVLLHDV